MLAIEIDKIAAKEESIFFEKKKQKTFVPKDRYANLPDRYAPILN